MDMADALPGARVASDEDVAEALAELEARVTCMETCTRAERASAKVDLEEFLAPDRAAMLAAADREDTADLLTRLRRIDGCTRLHDKLHRAVQEQRVQVHTGGPEASARGCVPLLGAPPRAAVPPGWVLTNYDLARMVVNKQGDLERVPAVPYALFPVRRFDSGDGEGAEVAVVIDGGRQAFRALLVDLTDPRRLHPHLNRVGAAVTMGEARNAVTFLAAAYGRNRRFLPCLPAVEHLGWQGPDGVRGFVAGSQLVTDKGADDVDAHMVWAPGTQQGGELESVEAFRQDGTLRGWVDAVGSIAAHPVPMLGVAASFAAVLLMPLRVRPFTLDIHGRQGRGKTTTLRLAASPWTYPDTKPDPAHGQPGGIKTWATTLVGIERDAAFRYGLPLLLDDSTNTIGRDPEGFRTSIVYMVANGRAKSRGAISGTVAAPPIHTLLISTGEAPVCGESTKAGSRARVLSVGTPPFPDGSAGVVERLERRLLANYGHAGPRFAQWVQEHRNSWPAWREEHHQLRTELTQEMFADTAARRLSEYAALLVFTLQKLGEVFGVACEERAVRRVLQEAMAVGDREADQAQEAFDLLLNWMSSRRHRFYPPENAERDLPPPSWLGIWRRSSSNSPIYPLSNEVNELLRQNGFQVSDITAQWAERGLLLPGQGARLTVVRRLGERRVRVYGIPRHHVVDCDGGEP